MEGPTDMEKALFLEDLVIVYGLGALVVYLFRKLRQSDIVGFLVTGMIAGPFGLSLVGDAESVHVLAEIGVMLLLFSLGLEFSLKKLLKMRWVVFGTGSVQVGLTILATVGIGTLAGMDVRTALFLGFLVALSSTAIVLKMLLDRGEIDSIHGRVSLGILIFQDLCVVPMIVLVPILADKGSILIPLSVALGRAVLVIIAVILLARYVFPTFLARVAGTRSRELFVITSLWILLGTAWALSQFGFSLALGAFLAGLTVSESEYSHQIVADIRPFRDGFNGLFFISMGMLVDHSFIWNNMGLVSALIAAIAAGKALLMILSIALTRLPLQVAVLVGIPMAQVGEFSFVLLEAGRRSGIVAETSYQHIIASAVATMLLTPLFFNVSRLLLAQSRVASLMQRFGKAANIRELERAEHIMHDHVLLCGFGVTGQNIISVLKENRIPYIILELNSDIIRKARSKGEPIFFGDCTDPEILYGAGIMEARVMVLAVSDPLATRMGVKTAREMNSELVILARNKYLAEIDELLNMGATEVISDEFESSIELLARILRVFHFPRQLVAQEIKSIRDNRYGIFRRPDTTVPRLRLSTRLDVYTETIRVVPGSPACGQKINEIGLRKQSGALIVGIIRDPDTLNNPDPSVRIEEGDLLVLSGTKEQLKLAMQMLSGSGAHPV